MWRFLYCLCHDSSLPCTVFRGAVYAWGSFPIFALFGLTLCSIGIMATIERKAIDPIFPMTYPAFDLKPESIATGTAMIAFVSSLSNTIGSAIFGAAANINFAYIYKAPIAFALLMIPAVLAFQDKCRSKVVQ